MYDLEKQTKQKRKICLSELSVIMPAAAGIMLFILLVYLCMTANIQIMKSWADDDFFVVHHVKSYEVQKEDLSNISKKSIDEYEKEYGYHPDDLDQLTYMQDFKYITTDYRVIAGEKVTVKKPEII